MLTAHPVALYTYKIQLRPAGLLWMQAAAKNLASLPSRPVGLLSVFKTGFGRVCHFGAEATQAPGSGAEIKRPDQAPGSGAGIQVLMYRLNHD